MGRSLNGWRLFRTQNCRHSTSCLSTRRLRIGPRSCRASLNSRILKKITTTLSVRTPRAQFKISYALAKNRLTRRIQRIRPRLARTKHGHRRDQRSTEKMMKKKSPSRMTAKNAGRNVHADENLAGRGSATTAQEQAIRPPSPAHIQGGKNIYALIIDGDGVDFARNQ